MKHTLGMMARRFRLAGIVLAVAAVPLMSFGIGDMLHTRRVLQSGGERLAIIQSTPPRQIQAPQTIPGVENSRGRKAFLDALLSQCGSTGKILPEDAEPYALWFARRQGYREQPWAEDSVAWCVCFLYWGIDACGEYLEFDFRDGLIRSADVDQFQASFSAGHWKTTDPLPGDIVFFDTDPTDEDPTVNHAGAVLEVRDDSLYIIEGNTLRGSRYPTGTAALRKYPLEDSRILGYGELNWK